MSATENKANHQTQDCCMTTKLKVGCEQAVVRKNVIAQVFPNLLLAPQQSSSYDHVAVHYQPLSVKLQPPHLLQ
eukprot:300101-Amphidinium_carterae.1